MALMVALTTSVACAVAKTVLSLWLREPGPEIAGSIIDVLKTKTDDALAQRNGDLQIQAIGLKVAESLIPMFTTEGGGLDEAECEAVALAVATTLDSTKVSAELLAQRDLEPNRLASYLFEARPEAASLFGEAGAQLYRRAITEISQSVVDIASQLPSFSEKTFSEILRRERDLLAIATTTLEEVRRMREDSSKANPELEAAAFETDYRRAVVRALDELQLFGVDVQRTSKRQCLSVAYVTLSVSLSGDDSTEVITGPAHEDHSSEAGQTEDENRDSLPVDAVLATSQRLLIRGDAGTGKTTLLQWIAVNAARQSFPASLQDWNTTIPFFIRLRQFADVSLPKPEDFPAVVVPSIAGKMPIGWAHDMLESGRALVLVDGLDEMPSISRSAVRDWLKGLTGAFEKARFVVTSRPSAVEEGWLESEGFCDAELQSMDLPDIYAFIEHWHEAVSQQLQSDEERAELPPLAVHLKEQMRTRRPLRGLATNPLLCAMLCALNRDRRRQLPVDRIELYEACCTMLMERRDLERGVHLAYYPSLAYRQKCILLEDLAYYLMTNRWSMVPAVRAAERLETKLANMQTNSRSTCSHSVLRLLIDRSGMIREPIPGRIDFTHRTFQEYLAAKAALDQRDIGVLIDHAHDDQWREVVILAAGRASRIDRDDLISSLIAKGDGDEVHRHQLHLLAVACLEASIELSPEVKREVEERLKGLVPPRSITEAKALASAGELALPFLHHRPMYAYESAASIRTLALIGGDEALNELAMYAGDNRQKPYAELMRSWESFDRNEYAQRVLSKFGGELRLEGVSSLEGIAGAGVITKLSIRGSDRLTDLAPLSSCAELESLTVSGCDAIRDLSPLMALTQLRRLVLVSYYAHTLRFRMDPGAVTHASGCGSWFEQLSGLTSLCDLQVAIPMGCADLSVLAPLSELTSVELQGFYDLIGFDALRCLDKLQILSLSGHLQHIDLSVLLDLPNLQILLVQGIAGKLDVPKGLRKEFEVMQRGRYLDVRRKGGSFHRPRPYF